MRPRKNFILALCAGLFLCSAPAFASQNSEDIRRDAVVRAVELAMPSVVNISTETIIEVRDPFDSLFREFFGPSWGRRSQQSLGSGVIIHEDGYILTNLHVVRRATRITVTLADGRVFEAVKLVGAAQSDAALLNDVALLKLVAKEREKFTAIRFAPDDDLLLGETVLALGNPFGLGGSVSRGILSSRARRPPLEDQPLDIEDWLQTDAAINPGNSGGPLVNLRGELIGISVAIFREAQGIGFAIPMKRISEALATLFTPEYVKQLWFGARFQFGKEGITLTSIDSGSPAEKAGLRTGDVVLRVNNKTPKSAFDVNCELINAADREIPLWVKRGGSEKKVILRMVPETEFFNAQLLEQKLGITLQSLTPDLASAMSLGRIHGLLVGDVERNSPAHRARIQPGDVVQGIDGHPVSDVAEAAKILYRKSKDDRVRLDVVVRRGTGNFIGLYSTAVELTVR